MSSSRGPPVSCADTMGRQFAPGSCRTCDCDRLTKPLPEGARRRHDGGSDREENMMQSGGKWVGTWAAAPAPAEGVVGFNNHTLRLNPRISLGGDRLRVRISNAYGNRPLTIGAVHIALRD